MLKLYDYPLSGNCYKIRLLLNLLGVAYEKVAVDFFPGREHRSPEFLRINPVGQLPVLDDDGLILRDSGAILLYLAAKYDASQRWYNATDPAEMARVAMWLAFADQITATASAARLHDVLNYELDIKAARAGAHQAFRVLDDHLTEREFHGGCWLVGDHATIADIACFPYTALAGDGGISLVDYAAIRRWLIAMKKLEGFIAMPGIHPLH